MQRARVLQLQPSPGPLARFAWLGSSQHGLQANSSLSPLPWTLGDLSRLLTCRPLTPYSLLAISFTFLNIRYIYISHLYIIKHSCMIYPDFPNFSPFLSEFWTI